MELKKRRTISNTEYFPKDSYKGKFVQQLIPAGFINFGVKTILAPLERWRIIAQTQKTYPLRPKKFTSFFNFISRAPKEQGFLSLWRSNTVHCWVYFYQMCFQIFVFDSINATQKQLLEDSIDLPILGSLLSNFFFPIAASASSLSIIYPLDSYRVQTAMCYHKEKKDAIFTKFRDRISQVSSFQDLYKGFWASILISTITFNFYRHVGSAFGQIQVEGLPKDLCNTDTVLSILAVGLVHPLDTIKKILQLNNMSKPALFTGYRSVLNYFREKQIPISDLYRGLTASLVRTTLFMPIFWGLHREWNNWQVPVAPIQ